MKTILDVRMAGLCHGCGTCAGVCPFQAIRMVRSESNAEYLPEIDAKKCTLCQLCVKCCPGHSVDFRKLNLECFGKQPSDNLLGNYLNCYVGHSNDYEIRYDSSSGGIASQLLIFALERKIVDGALVIGMKDDKPLEPKPFIARSKDEIISASRSKYCPVSANEALQHIQKENGKFAVVGLPCHIHGIRKAESVDSKLKGKIVLHICLLCSHMANFLGTEFILKKVNVPKEQVKQLAYRGQGWPGAMTIKLGQRSSVTIPLVGSWNSYWPIFSSFFFTPTRCTLCPDQAGELADISLGDAWLPEMKGDKIGESVIVTRTQIAETILSEMASAGIISVKAIKPEKVKQSQALNLKFKKRDLSTRLAMFKLLDRQVPRYTSVENSWSLSSFLRALYIYFNIGTSSNKRIRSALERVPIPLFRLYFGVYKYLSVLA